MVKEQSFTRVDHNPKDREKNITLKLSDTTEALWAEQQILDRKLEIFHFNTVYHKQWKAGGEEEVR